MVVSLPSTNIYEQALKKVSFPVQLQSDVLSYPAVATLLSDTFLLQFNIMFQHILNNFLQPFPVTHTHQPFPVISCQWFPITFIQPQGFQVHFVHCKRNPRLFTQIAVNFKPAGVDIPEMIITCLWTAAINFP